MSVEGLPVLDANGNPIAQLQVYRNGGLDSEAVTPTDPTGVPYSEANPFAVRPVEPVPVRQWGAFYTLRGQRFISSGINPVSTSLMHAFSVTPNDADTFDPPIEVYVGGAGNVTIVPGRSDGLTTVTFTAVAAGSRLPCRALKVMATGTTATALVGVV